MVVNWKPSYLVVVPKSITSYCELPKQSDANHYSERAIVPIFRTQYYHTRKANSFFFKMSTTAGTPSETINVKLADWASVFNRFAIKSSDGFVLRYTYNAHMLSKFTNLVSVSDHAKINEVDFNDWLYRLCQSEGWEFSFLSYYLSNEIPTQFWLNLVQPVPLHLMAQSLAFNIELYLEGPE